MEVGRGKGRLETGEGGFGGQSAASRYEVGRWAVKAAVAAAVDATRRRAAPLVPDTASKGEAGTRKRFCGTVPRERPWKAASGWEGGVMPCGAEAFTAEQDFRTRGPADARNGGRPSTVRLAEAKEGWKERRTSAMSRSPTRTNASANLLLETVTTNTAS